MAGDFFGGGYGGGIVRHCWYLIVAIEVNSSDGSGSGGSRGTSDSRIYNWQCVELYQWLHPYREGRIKSFTCRVGC